MYSMLSVIYKTMQMLDSLTIDWITVDALFIL